MTNNYVTVNVDVDVWLGEIDDDDLVAELESRGYRVISPDDGFEDDLLDGEIDFDPEAGLGHA